jgi:glycine/D-amino acid oxidase-like deaminating enzyme
MSTATAEWGLSIVPPVKPRKGHLLVLGPMKDVHLKHGMMEFEYLSHSGTSYVDAVENSNSKAVLESSLELAMTATLDQNGNLLLGSSREFVGFDVEVHTQVVESIINRARKFLSGLSDVSLEHALQSGFVRTGLRPFGMFSTRY